MNKDAITRENELLINAAGAPRYIYVMISQTPTKFGATIRKIGHVEYNHTAVSLDANLNQLYAFARPQHNALLLARLVHESIPRYTLDIADNVPVVIYKVPVTSYQYNWIRRTIKNVLNDSDYIYNYTSVFTYPIFKGISTEKAFSCIEFVMYLLNGIGYNFIQPLCAYKPDDLQRVLSEYEFFKGNLLDYCEETTIDADYFEPFNYALFKESMGVILKVVLRTNSLQRVQRLTHHVFAWFAKC